MKIAAYNVDTELGRVSRTGILLNETEILDVNLLWKLKFQKDGWFNFDQRSNHFSPSSLRQILDTKEDSLDFFNQTMQLFNDFKKDGDLKLLDGTQLVKTLSNSVSLACPIDSINCYRDFYVHEKHVAKGFELRKEPIPESWYEIPAYYKGATSGFIGIGEEVMWPSYTKILDYELELAAVIGRDGINVKEKDAYKHILGFTILNDISARDIQKKEMSIRLGPAKGKDFCSVLGPVITTMDEFNFEEPKLKMQAFINGEKWSEGNSGDGHYSFAQMIEHLSKEEWMRASDVLGSGTVGTGCGLELRRWIQPGDEIVLEVEKIGSLRNKIGKKREE